jgi:hypothetical protein
MERHNSDSAGVVQHRVDLQLKEARLQCHYAVQINTRVARGLVPAKTDDSHTSLGWDAEREALMGQPFPASDRELQVGLRIRDLTLLFDNATLPLDGVSLDDALGWLREQLKLRGLEAVDLGQPLGFELEDHPLLHGAKFHASGLTAELEVLAGCYANAANSISELAAPVRCWPHHFDIAALITEGERSIGIGMSPGDGSYEEPYYYVSPWPAPSHDRLPALNSPGHWHTKEWTGAVLTASEFADGDSQETTIRTFLREALTVCTKIIEG